jgi:hypothetical protein
VFARSFGIILYECLTLSMPYASLMTDKLIYAEVHSAQKDALIYNVQQKVPDGYRPELPASADGLAGPALHPDPAVAAEQYSKLRDLIMSCWAADPSDRPAMSEVAEILSNVLNEIRKNRDVGGAASASGPGLMHAGYRRPSSSS